jgi:hypothetical protein
LDPLLLFPIAYFSINLISLGVAFISERQSNKINNFILKKLDLKAE